MKRMIGLTMILLTAAGCASSSKTAHIPKDVEVQAQAIQSLENRINLLEDSHLKLLVRSNTQRWELDTRIKALEEILEPGSISPVMKEPPAPDDPSLEGRVAKLEGQVKQLQKEIAELHKIQRPQQLIPVDPEPKPRVVPVK